MGIKKDETSFKRRMTVLLTLMKDGEKTVLQLLNSCLFDLEKTALNVLMRNLYKEGYVVYRKGIYGEYIYRISDQFLLELKSAIHAT